ncbi:MAG: S8 family serine peptidase [Desulfococcaceae bacterium]
MDAIGKDAAMEMDVLFRWIRFLPLIFLVGMLPPSAGAASSPKISPRLRHRLADYPAWPVILLCRTQLFEGPGGFSEFQRKHRSRPRSAIRETTLARLKEIAAAEQKAVLRALGNPEQAESLWIVNAVGLTLNRAGVERAASLDEVAYIYADRSAPSRNSAGGTVAEVIRPESPAPFSPEGKRIAGYLKAIQASRVWRKLKIAGEGTVVALFDSGADYRHPDLRNRVWTNPGEVADNGKDDDGNGLVDDFYGYDFATGSPRVLAREKQGHGTWTGGLIAGDGSAGRVTGVAPRTRLMLLIGPGSFCHAARVFEYALESGADVLNMSFSWPGLGQERGLIRRMCEHAVAAGLVPVSGAGNFGKGGGNPAPIPVQLRVPEGIPCVIAAGGVTGKGHPPPFASQGPVEWAQIRFYEDHPLPGGLVKPDICAFPGPGYALLDHSGKGYIAPNHRIGGNSFSGAMVSGVVALMLSAAPELPAWRVKEILEETARPLGSPRKNNRTGSGLVDAWKAVRAAKKAASTFAEHE